MILFNPHHHDRKYPDEKSRDLMLKTIEFFETQGAKADQKGLARQNLELRFRGIPTEEPGLRDVDDAVGIRRRRFTMGHVPQLRVLGDRWILRDARTGTPCRCRCWGSSRSGAAPTRR